MKNRKCPVCHCEYDDGGNTWKKVCYPCYKDYRYWKRIQPLRHKEDLYITHPSVTKEELEEYIRKNELECGWGPEEFKPEDWLRFKLWRNDTNYD